MKNTRLLLLFLLFSSAGRMAFAQENIPQDTAVTGIYITSIHDIDFKEKEYSVNLWLWMKYKRRDIDFAQNLEVPQAKNFTKAYSTMDSSNGMYFLTMKLQCVMKDSWRTNNFPFDKQYLRLSFENSQFDSSALVFALDSSGDLYDKRYALQGWKIDSCVASVRSKTYNTTFGVPGVEKKSIYSSYKIRILLHRDSMGLFLKLFLGMYISFLIAYACFYIHADNIDSRFGLSVGALFAVIGNKYIIDSSLPETTTFTLVDILHETTLFFILLIIFATAYSLILVKKGKEKESKRFDFIAAQACLLAYILLNLYFIWHAIKG